MSVYPEHIPSVSTELVPWQEKPLLHLVEQKIGRHALLFEGFEPMQEVESPFSELRTELKTKIIDQPDAITAIIDALERSETRLPNDKRPITNLAFLGPSGVGKSQTAKVLSGLLGNGNGKLIKIDCSNFANGHEVATLTGSPPGWVGHDIEPLLSKKNVENGDGAVTVVLFDEIEKGANELYNLMLQVMGDGELRMNTSGEVTSFRETVIIITSNLGAKEMHDKLSDTPFGLGESKKKEVNKDDLNQTAKKSFEKFFKFKPEFVNRLNDMVVFHPLGPDGLENVLDVKVAEANSEYEKQLGTIVSLSDATKAHLVEIALKQPYYGARPLVRAFEENVQTVFGRYTGGGHVQEGTHIRVFHSSEAPANYSHSTDTELIFTSKADESIKKWVPPVETEPEQTSPLQVAIAALPANPEKEYEVMLDEPEESYE